jgi:hypothetical protein
MSMRLLSQSSAVGSTLTNATAETVLASYEFPANFWTAGKVVDVDALVTVPSTNSTDTLTVRGRFGAAALTGTAVCTTGAVDAVNGDIAPVKIRLACRSVTNGVGVIVAIAQTVMDAPGTALGAHGQVLSSVDVTAKSYVGITGQWSVASASNQCANEMLVVSEIALS